MVDIIPLNCFQSTYFKEVVWFFRGNYLNNDFKRNVNAQSIPKNKEELAENTERFMKHLENNPSRVANYFKHEKIQYASGMN